MGKSHSTSVLNQTDTLADTDAQENEGILEKGMVVSQSVDQIMESTLDRMEANGRRGRDPSGRKVRGFDYVLYIKQFEISLGFSVIC